MSTDGEDPKGDDASGLAALFARIAELEAANKICRTDIEALMRSADSLETRNTELETKWAHTVDALRAANERNTELEVVLQEALLSLTSNNIGRVFTIIRTALALSDPAERADRIGELEAALEGAEQRGALILEVIAERDRLKAALEAVRLRCEHHSQYEHDWHRIIGGIVRDALSDPSEMTGNS